MRERGAADRERPLAGVGAGEREARVENLVAAHQLRVAERNLLIVNLDFAVGLHIDRLGDQGIVSPCLLAIAEFQEPGGLRALLIIQAKVALVSVVREGRIQGAVVRGHTRCG